MSKSKKPLKSIKTGVVSRSASLTSLAVKSGLRIATAKIKGGSSASESALEEVFTANALSIVEELGRLKGSVMKMGQSLAVLGEHFFPKEVAQILRKLNENSEAIAWEVMEETLVRSLGREKLSKLNIVEESFAAASLGQVHRATIIESGEEICLKIQYPGVAQSIDSDLKTLRSILKIARLLPSAKDKVDQIFDEVKAMLKMEVDFNREAKHMAHFRDWLHGDDRYRIPDLFEEFSSRLILATSFERGVGIDGPEVAALPLEKRSRIAEMYTELFLRELFYFRCVQSDPHFGNYKIRVGEDQEPDTLVLLDFGAVRKFNKTFIKSYYQLLWGAFTNNRNLIVKGGIGIGFLLDSDGDKLLDHFCSFCDLVIEPWLPIHDSRANQSFYNKDKLYTWHETDLSKRLQEAGRKLAVDFKFRLPPREIVFLDRKLAGVFTTLKLLAAPFDASQLMANVLEDWS